MLKQYLVVSYAYLVKIGRWDLEPAEGSQNRVVPDEYKTIVAEYLAE